MAIPPAWRPAIQGSTQGPSISSPNRAHQGDVEPAQDIGAGKDQQHAGEPPLTPAQAQELDRRLEEHRSNPQAGIPWEQVKAELEGRS